MGQAHAEGQQGKDLLFCEGWDFLKLPHTYTTLCDPDHSYEADISEWRFHRVGGWVTDVTRLVRGGDRLGALTFNNSPRQAQIGASPGGNLEAPASWDAPMALVTHLASLPSITAPRLHDGLW